MQKILSGSIDKSYVLNHCELLGNVPGGSRISLFAESSADNTFITKLVATVDYHFKVGANLNEE